MTDSRPDYAGRYIEGRQFTLINRHSNKVAGSAAYGPNAIIWSLLMNVCFHSLTALQPDHSRPYSLKATATQ